MLSKAETEYLKGERHFNDNYRYYLTHSIKSKLPEFESQDIPALLTQESTRETILRIFSKTLREFPKTGNLEQEMVSVNALNCEASQRVRCGGWDLNPRTANRADLESEQNTLPPVVAKTRVALTWLGNPRRAGA